MPRTKQPREHSGDGKTMCPTCGKRVWMVIHSCKGVWVAAGEDRNEV